MTTVIEGVIYDKPAVMGLVTPFSDVYMIIGKETVMFFHQALHSMSYTYCVNCGCYIWLTNIKYT